VTVTIKNFINIIIIIIIIIYTLL